MSCSRTKTPPPRPTRAYGSSRTWSAATALREQVARSAQLYGAELVTVGAATSLSVWTILVTVVMAVQDGGGPVQATG